MQSEEDPLDPMKHTYEVSFYLHYIPSHPYSCRIHTLLYSYTREYRDDHGLLSNRSNDTGLPDL